MTFKDLVIKNRSYRRFENSCRIEKEVLYDLIDDATKVASAANLQVLRYVVSNTKKENDEIYRCLNWAGYLTDWDGPSPHERPCAYIILTAKDVYKNYSQLDAGIAAQTILLSAVEKGYGGCMIASINKELLSRTIGLEEEDSILLCIALGRPIEEVVLEEIDSGNVEYWRDDKQIHHVPKRDVQEVIKKEYLD
jgi:nitroreductase